ncbi:MAG TPA: hypothetical protein VFB73_06915 [Chloroflexota bacterium]|nr:hypothetical protein [Chloroflexota bacterium]
MRAWLPAVLLLTLLACTPNVRVAAVPGSDPGLASWPPPDQALQAASAAMASLQSLREQVSTRTYRNDTLFLAIDAERAYVAPDRRYERMEGRSAVETVAGETVMIGSRFFKRLGDGPWQQLDWTETFTWPAAEYSFAGVRDVSYGGTDTIDGRTARILVLHHEGSAETRNAGWQFETRLWIDPQTGYFLRRETRGKYTEPDPVGGKATVQRYEGTWVYRDHNGPIRIVEPSAAPEAR